MMITDRLLNTQTCIIVFVFYLHWNLCNTIEYMYFACYLNLLEVKYLRWSCNKFFTGYFWQVTDFHYDANYSTHGDPSKMCHYSPSAIHYDLGMYSGLIWQPFLFFISSLFSRAYNFRSTKRPFFRRFYESLVSHLHPQANVLYSEVFLSLICELHVINLYPHNCIQISCHAFQVNLGIICVIHRGA